MEVILLERVAKLGQMGETVRVKDGFARNFLLPKGKALRATAIIWSTSPKVCASGFSHWTCLLRRRHSIDIAACQWSGVAIQTASTDLSSKMVRMSLTGLAFPPDCSTCAAAAAKRLESTSQT